LIVASWLGDCRACARCAAWRSARLGDRRSVQPFSQRVENCSKRVGIIL
jgi:hypothetical protein